MSLGYVRKGLVPIGVVAGLIIGTKTLRHSPVSPPTSQVKPESPAASPSPSLKVTSTPIFALSTSSGRLEYLNFTSSSSPTVSPTLSPGNRPKFFCGNYQDQYVMFVRTPHRGNVPVVSWEKRIENLSPEDRCRIVSERFQRFDTQGLLKYITTGTMNHQSVVCVVAYQDGPCLPNGLLVTITSTSTSSERILDQIRNLNQGRGLEAGSSISPSPMAPLAPKESPLW